MSSTDEQPFAEPPSADPRTPVPVDTAAWRDAPLWATWTMRLPLWWQPRDGPRAVTPSQLPYRVFWYTSSTVTQKAIPGPAWLVGWLYARPGFPGGQYSPDQQIRVVERATGIELIDGRELHVATWRISPADARSDYGLAAYWPVAVDRWLQLAAEVPTRSRQIEVLAALRTVRMR